LEKIKGNPNMHKLKGKFKGYLYNWKKIKGNPNMHSQTK